MVKIDAVNDEKIISNLGRSIMGMQTQAKVMLGMLKPILKKHGIDLKPVVVKRKEEPTQIIFGWLLKFPNEQLANLFLTQTGVHK